MKNIKTMIAVFSAAVTCVSAAVSPLSNCFAADAETGENVTSKTVLVTSAEKIKDQNTIYGILNDYITEAKIPAELYYNIAGGISVMYDCKNENYKGEIKDKIIALASKNNIDENAIFFDVQGDYDPNDGKIMNINEIRKMLIDYMNEAKISIDVYWRFDSSIEKSYLEVMYDSRDGVNESKIKDKITAFLAKNNTNINKDSISYFDMKNAVVLNDGKIADHHIIIKMLTEYVKESDLKANIFLINNNELIGDYVEVKYDFRHERVEGEIEDKINAFIAENNIAENTVYFHELELYTDDTSDLTNITGSTPIATGSDLEKTAKWGDVNTDGAVDISDVVKLNMYLLDKTACPLSEQGLVNANCAYDDVIDAADAVIINNYVCMMIDYSELGPKK